MVSLRSGSVLGKDQAADTGAAEVTSRKSREVRKSATPQPPKSTKRAARKNNEAHKPTGAEEKEFLTSESAHALPPKIASRIR